MTEVWRCAGLKRHSWMCASACALPACTCRGRAAAGTGGDACQLSTLCGTGDKSAGAGEPRLGQALAVVADGNRVPAGLGRRGAGRQDQLDALNAGFMERLRSFNLDAELNAMEQAGRGRVASSPRAFTTDRNQAKIIKGFQVPSQQSASDGARSVSFKEAAHSLDVTPLVNGTKRQILPKVRIFVDAIKQRLAQTSV